MVPEAPLEATDAGTVARGEGWFVLNARDAVWWERPGRGAFCDFEAGTDFRQLGVNVTVLRPGEPMAMYHWEADQEDFLVVAGEALLVVEEEERPLRTWDFVHCPPGTRHVIVGAGAGPCVVVCVGARERSTGPEWGAYSVSDAAQRHGAGVERETTEPREAYARFGESTQTRYRDGWLPG
ncbi:MAG TPA: cupin domain-containing protein [Gaiellaceae bacterium]|nr:cupin domain-containing protein [Gaiellaceae bacterium]